MYKIDQFRAGLVIENVPTCEILIYEAFITKLYDDSACIYFRYPCFENPYPMDIHESPVTSCQYFADCPTDLIPALYSVGSSKQKRTGFSEKV